MNTGVLTIGLLAAGIALGALLPKAQAADWTQPMTEWGEPDIQGKWPVGHLSGIPLVRDPKYGDRKYLTDEEYAPRLAAAEAQNERYRKEIEENKMGMGHWTEATMPSRRTSFIVKPENGQLPALTEEGRRRKALMRSSWMDIPFDSVKDFDTWDRCITRGLPSSMMPYRYNNGIQIIQSPGYVVIRLEMIHESRIIPTDGRKALPAAIHNWMGSSRGHWEGNTLVVETTHFREGPSSTNVAVIGSPPHNDTPTSTEARMVERFTMQDQNHMLYEVTWDDPVVYKEPYTAELDYLRDPDYGFFEYACHEDNETIRNYINSSRAERAQEAKTEKAKTETGQQ